MRSKALLSLVLACTVAGLAALSGCKSNGSESSTSSHSSDEVPCICGEPEAAIHGCYHPRCMAGETNPDNDHCVCGPMDLRDEEN